MKSPHPILIIAILVAMFSIMAVLPFTSQITMLVTATIMSFLGLSWPNEMILKFLLQGVIMALIVGIPVILIMSRGR